MHQRSISKIRRKSSSAESFACGFNSQASALPMTTGQCSARSRSITWRGWAPVAATSPRQMIRSSGRASISARTASRAIRLAWISEIIATRIVLAPPQYWFGNYISDRRSKNRKLFPDIARLPSNPGSLLLPGPPCRDRAPLRTPFQLRQRVGREDANLAILLVGVCLAAEGAGAVAEDDVEHLRVAVGWAVLEIEEHRLVEQQTGLLDGLAPGAVAGRLAELQVADRQVPDAHVRLDRPPQQHNAALVLDDDGGGEVRRGVVRPTVARADQAYAAVALGALQRRRAERAEAIPEAGGVVVDFGEGHRWASYYVTQLRVAANT